MMKRFQKVSDKMTDRMMKRMADRWMKKMRKPPMMLQNLQKVRFLMILGCYASADLDGRLMRLNHCGGV